MNPDVSPGSLAQIACVLEATARKPGNVHRFKDFDDATYLDFVLSAMAIGHAMDQAPVVGHARAILLAVQATQRYVRTNTNLGMILLLAPLCEASASTSLRQALSERLADSRVEDAQEVYEAIRLARPGGLGIQPDQDLAGIPTVSLVEVMRLASDRDTIARQFTNGFSQVFELAVPTLVESLESGQPLETALVSCHLRIMAECPDTLIARKCGVAESEASARCAERILRSDWPESVESRALFEDFDAWLREKGHLRNPGTTADLVCAGTFVALRDGTIPLPLNAANPPWSRTDNGGGPLI